MTQMQGHARSFRANISLIGLVVTLVTWSIVHSLSVYPHSLSYFNECSGGPERGSRHLLGSNVDWGQDFMYLKQWINRQQTAKPIYVWRDGFFDPRSLGLNCIALNDPRKVIRFSSAPDGWYAIGINQLLERGVLEDSTSHTRFHAVKTDPLSVALNGLAPVARIGYSLFIFRVSSSET